MKDYEVSVSLMMESDFTVNVEADSEDEAQNLVKDQVWDDQLTQEIRNNRSINSEQYTAEQVMYDFDLYDEDDAWVVTMYDYADEATALEEYNNNLVSGEIAADYAERR